MLYGAGQNSGDSHVAGTAREHNRTLPHPTLLAPPRWDDYELIDTGDGMKLERFGDYRLVRPETQAIWLPGQSPDVWQQVDATFQRGRSDEGAGSWVFRQQSLPDQWMLQHDGLHFWARLTPFRHTGIFPEHSAHWQWMRQQLGFIQSPQVLVLFGYTGLHTLVAAQVGARVCHVDASRPAMRWAQANQELSHLQDRPVRWIVDDVNKFVAREIRRGSRYDMIIMDPPVFGRGPKGQIWRLNEALRPLMEDCVRLLSRNPVGLLVNAYATSISSVTLFNIVQMAMRPYGGEVLAGELVLVEAQAARALSTALFARWSPMA
jgi:23S rRNA (cytosine1962-C5)-methyltransferase